MTSEKIIYDPTLVSMLLDLLLDIYHIVRPKPSDYEHRRRLFQMLNTMVKDVFGNSGGFPILLALGSFTMDLFTARSDVDLSVNFSNDRAVAFPRNKTIAVLRKFARALYAQQRKGHVSGVLPLLKARVPTLKVVDGETGIGCDITVENKDGICRSLILKIVSSIDGRFRILCYLMKAWAKAQGINSSQHRTLNSLSVTTLAVLHLQTRDPPILPPFSTLLRDGTDISSVQKIASGFRDFSKRNEESVAELFDSLFRKLALLQSSWEHGLCASAYEGSWIYKTWESGVACMNVEDFLDRSENFARAVGKDGMQKIYRCIWSSLYHLTRFMEGQIEVSELKKLLFGPILLNIPSQQLSHDEGMDLKRRLPLQGSSAGPHEPITMKRARCSEAIHNP